MRKTKRWFSLVLCVIMLCSLLPMHAHAGEWGSMEEFYADGGKYNCVGNLYQCNNCDSYFDEDDCCPECYIHVGCQDDIEWEYSRRHHIDCEDYVYCFECDRIVAPDEYCLGCLAESAGSSGFYHDGCSDEEGVRIHRIVCEDLSHCWHCGEWIPTDDFCWDCAFVNIEEIWHPGCGTEYGEISHLIICEDYRVCELCEEPLPEEDFCDTCLAAGFYNHDGCDDGDHGWRYHMEECLEWYYCDDCEDFFEEEVEFCDNCGLCMHEWEECDACGEPCNCVCLDSWCDECDVCENVYSDWACETCGEDDHEQWHLCEEERCSECGMCETAHDDYYGAQECEDLECDNYGGCPSLCECWEDGFTNDEVMAAKEAIAALPPRTAITVTVLGSEEGTKLTGVRAYYKTPEGSWAYLGVSDENGMIIKNVSETNPMAPGFQVRLGDGSTLVTAMGAQWGVPGTSLVRSISFTQAGDKEYTASAEYNLPKYQDISSSVKGTFQVGINMPGAGKYITQSLLDSWVDAGYFDKLSSGYESDYYGIFMIPVENGVPVGVAEMIASQPAMLDSGYYGFYIENLPQGEYIIFIVLPGCRLYVEEGFTFVVNSDTGGNWIEIDMKKESATPPANTATLEVTHTIDLDTMSESAFANVYSAMFAYSINEDGKKLWSVNEFETAKFRVVTGEMLFYPYFGHEAVWYLTDGDLLGEGDERKIKLYCIVVDENEDSRHFDYTPGIEFQIDGAPVPKNKKINFTVKADVPGSIQFMNITAPGTLGGYTGLTANGLPNTYRGPEMLTYRGTGKEEVLYLSNYSQWFQRNSYSWHTDVEYIIDAYCDGYSPLKIEGIRADDGVIVFNFETGVCNDSHTWGYTGTVESCGNQTRTRYAKCTVCGKTESFIQQGADIAHAWHDGAITTYPTATTAGKRLQSCLSCGKTQEKIIAAHECNDSNGNGYNDTHHWDNCSICEGTTVPAAHSFNPTGGGHDARGVMKHECACGATAMLPVSHGTDCEVDTWTVAATRHYHTYTCGAEVDSAPHTFDAGVLTAYNTDFDQILYTCTVCAGTKNALLLKGDTPISAIALTAPAPVRGSEVAKASDVKGGTGYTVASVSWTPSDSVYKAATEYSVTITLEAAAGYSFISPAVTLNGSTATVLSSGYDQLVLGYTFPATGKAPDSPGSSGGGTTPAKTDTEKAVEVIEKAKPGDTVKLELGDKTVVDKAVFEAIAGKDITVEISVGDAVWVIDGKDVPKTGLSSLDLGVSVGESTIPVDIINTITGEKSTVQIVLKHEGPFGFTMLLQISLGRENSELYANLYFYNKTTGEMEFKTASQIGIDGKVELVFNRASEYAIVIDTKTHGEVIWGNPFIDVKESDWFYGDVKYVYENDMMTGTGPALFSPQMTTTRAMIVTILYRLEGEPSISGDAGFADVPAGTWYTSAVAWAQKNGIVNGYSDELFGPDDPITREQMAVILMNYAQYKGYNVSGSANLTAFSDANQVSDWAKDAITWANAEGLISGKGGGILDPKGNATRAEAAAILARFCENIVK